MKVLVLTVPVDLSEVVSDQLWGLGVAAIEERPPAGSASDSRESGSVTELWTSLGEDTDLIVSCLTDLGFPATPGDNSGHEIWWRWEEISDAAINSWRDHAQPFEIVEDLWVIPEWISTNVSDHVGNEASSRPTQMIIDPGSAFGMGDHPTTRLSLRLLLRHLNQDEHVFDLGCGSGILGIAALLFGAGFVTATDISPAALEATRSNALVNKVETRIEVSLTPLGELAARPVFSSLTSEPVGILVANILAPALISMAEDMLRVCTPDTRIIISGILEDNCAHVIAAFSPWSVIDQVSEAGWTALLLAAPSPD
jgi:ribosomal protein L11 methyltransferase